MTVIMISAAAAGGPARAAERVRGALAGPSGRASGKAATVTAAVGPGDPLMRPRAAPAPAAGPTGRPRLGRGGAGAAAGLLGPNARP